MRYFVSLALALFLLGTTPYRAHAQLGGAIGVLGVGVVLDRFADRLDGMIGRAGQTGDFLLEKNGRILQAVVRDAHIQLVEVLGKNVNELKLEHRNFLGTLNTLVEDLRDSPKRVLELQDFLALDLENIVGQMPGQKSLFGAKLDRLSFRRLDGYSQVFQKEGVYSFRFIGAAFGPDFRSVVHVNGTRVKLFDARTPRVYVMEFDVPVEVLNHKFSDGKVERVDIQVECFAEGKDKPVFTYKNQILLLPKHPVAVKLVERHTVKEWSSATFWSEEGSAFLPRTNVYPKGDEPSTRGTASVTIPKNCLMLKETVETRFEPANLVPWSRWDKETHFTNEDLTVSKSCKHWLQKTDCRIYLKVKYRKPESVTRERGVPIGTAVEGKNLLPFGTTLVNLSAEYQSFTLEATWFNGQKNTLAPVQLSRPGIKTALETTSPPRLLIDLSWPEFGAKR